MRHSGYSKDKFALMLGMDLGDVEDVVVKNVYPQEEMIKRIAENFDNINDEWLRTGKGEMLKSNGKKSDEDALRDAVADMQRVSERIAEYLKKKK